MRKMYEEINMTELRNDLKRKFDLVGEIKGNRLCFDEFNGYIVSDDRYCEVEDLCKSICERIQDKYDCFCDYSLLDEEYEFIIEIF